MSGSCLSSVFSSGQIFFKDLFRFVAIKLVTKISSSSTKSSSNISNITSNINSNISSNSISSSNKGISSSNDVSIRSGMKEAARLKSSSLPHPGRIACGPAPDRRPPATKALQTVCGNTSIVWSSWRWAYMCPKHVEQIISSSAINHSVASSCFSSLRDIWRYEYSSLLEYDALPNGFYRRHEAACCIHLRCPRTTR